MALTYDWTARGDVTARAARARKYAVRERERRFLLRAVPDLPEGGRLVEDTYLPGTGLRLRRVTEPDGTVVRKLGHKIREDSGDSLLHTSLYLDEAEWERLQRGGDRLVKRRHALDDVAVDVFEGAHAGLVLAEVDLGAGPDREDLEARLRESGLDVVREVTGEEEFTGGALAAHATATPRSAAPGSTMRIRPMEERDWPQVHDLVVEVAATGETYAMDVPRDEAATRTFWTGEHNLVAVDGDTVLGAAKLGPNRPAQGSHVATASFMVGVDARGRGVGRALGEHAVGLLRDRGYRAIQFNAVVAANVAAVALWRSLGFEVVGTLSGGFRLPDGSWSDLLVMYLDLAAAPPDHVEAGRGDLDRTRTTAVAAAAARVFPRYGWSGTTVAAIATEAGLRDEEMTSRFGSKADLLILAMRHRGAPEHPDLPEAFADLRLEQVDEVDERLRRIAEFEHDLIKDLAPLVPVLWQAAQEDPAAAALRQGAELRRLAVSRTIVRLLRRGDDVRPDAVGAVQTLTTAENYLCLRGLGWSRERYVAWLAGSLDHAVNG